MNAIVVIPPVFDFYYTPHRSSGLGAEVVLRLLTESGWQARLLNFPRLAKKAKKQSLPPVLDHLKPCLIDGEFGKTSFFNQYKRFGPCLEECARQTLVSGPDVIFISCFAYCYAQTALDLARQIRQSDPRPMIVVGGAGVSAYPAFFLDNAAVDFALTGEAEVSLPVFLDTITSGSGDYDRVPNLFQKNNADIRPPIKVKQTDAGEIAFVLNKTFETSGAVYYSTTLSRGCPKACRFCSNFISHGRQFRTVPLETIRSFLQGLTRSEIEPDKQVLINFEDDNFLCNAPYFFKVLDVFKMVFPKAGFLAENGIDYTLITPEILEKLIRYGMKQFNLSMVSVDEQMLEHEQRAACLKQYETITNVLEKHGIPCVTYFICGLKHDTREKIVETVCYLAGQPTRVGISFFYPVPGIPGFTGKKIFTGIHPTLCAGSSVYPWNRSLSTREMITAFRLSRLVNLIKTDERTTIDDMVVGKSIAEHRLFTLLKKGGNAELMPVPDMDDRMVDLFFGRLPANLLERCL